MNSSKKQSGFTLVELMITGALGIVVSFFVISIMNNSTRTASLSEGTAQAEENGRFALAWLGEQLRTKPGYAPPGNPDVQPFMATPSAACLGDADTSCSVEESNPAAAPSDRLAIRRVFNDDINNQNYTTNCAGDDLAGLGVNNDNVIVDVFWVEIDTDDFANPDNDNDGNDDYDYSDVLRCQTFTENGNAIGNATTLVNGIEGMQVLYGFARDFDDPNTLIVNEERIRYLNADEVNNEFPGGRGWQQVISVKVAILARSFSENVLEQATRSYILLDANPYTFVDTRVARAIQSSTFYIPSSTTRLVIE